MGVNRPDSGVEPLPEEHSPSRRLDELPVLLALATIVLGVMALQQLLFPRPPSDDSPEAGFARDMITHHAQAVQMADIVRQRTESEEIRILATDIALSQQGEIGQMRGWLEIWGLPASGIGSAMEWMGHPTQGRMPGMATPEDLLRLHQASPEEADEQFLRLMIPHHQSAVEMAEAVQERTDRPEVARFAEKTVFAQQAEILNMQALLQRKGISPVEDEVSLAASNEEDHHGEEGFAASIPAVARDTALLAPLSLAVLAIAWLILDAIRRRRAWRYELSEPPTPPPVLWAAAAGGLAISAILHTGLAPAHFEAATSHGVFFSAASVVAAIAAAAVLAWPSRPAYLAGAGIALTLIVLWAVFRLVPPPGAETAEEVDLVGLFTKATELVAAAACAALWLRERRTRRSKQGSADQPASTGG